MHSYTHFYGFIFFKFSYFQLGICQLWWPSAGWCAQPHRWTSGSHPTLMESVSHSLGRNMQTSSWIEVILWGSGCGPLWPSWAASSSPGVLACLLAAPGSVLRGKANLLATVNRCATPEQLSTTSEESSGKLDAGQESATKDEDMKWFVKFISQSFLFPHWTG